MKRLFAVLLFLLSCPRAFAQSAPLTMNNSGAGAASGTTYNGSTAETLSYNTLGAAPATGSTSYLSNVSIYSSSTTYSSGAVVLYDYIYYVSLVGSNMDKMPSTSPAYWSALSSGIVSIKKFGAAGDGTTPDDAAIQAGFTYIAAHGGCLYFPSGTYITLAQLTWQVASQPLCLHGENAQSTTILYQGTPTNYHGPLPPIDAAIYVGTSDSSFSAVDIRDIGIGANSNASYAFHGVIVGPPANIDNVYMGGGSVSSFEGDFWNGQSDIRNLNVSGYPAGTSQCVNGITFSAPMSGDIGPSSQFTLTMPTVKGCTGTGLYMPQAEGVTINNAQLSGNYRQLYLGCSVFGCNNSGNTINTALIEEPPSPPPPNPPTYTPSVIASNRNKFNNINGSLDISGSWNVFDASQLNTLTIESTAVGTSISNSEIYTIGTSDSGTGTVGCNNYNEFSSVWTGSFGTCGATATNLAGGAAYQTPYQSAPNTTAFAASPASTGTWFYAKTLTGSSDVAPAWSNLTLAMLNGGTAPSGQTYAFGANSVTGSDFTITGGTFRGTSVTGTDGTEGLTIQAYGFGLGAIYPSGVTPGPTNYLFAGGATSGDPTIIDAPSGSGEVIDLQVSAATIAMLSVTGFTLNSGTLYGWNNDTSLSRGAADNVDCGNGTQGDASCAFAAGLHETTLATLASASNISPATGMFSLSGTSPISTITLPTGVSSTVGACLDILATGAWSTTTVGNIATAMTAISGTQYRACYFGSAWYIK